MAGLRRILEGLAFTASAAGFMFLLVTVPMLAWLAGKGLRDPLALASAAFPPASAGIGLTALSLLAPGLTGKRRIEGALVVTYPTLYCALALLAARLLALYQPTVAELAERPRADQYWASPPILAAAWIVLVSAFWWAAHLSSKRSEEPQC